MDIESAMVEIAAALPERGRFDSRTVRDVSLTLSESGWTCLAGGHAACHIGEYGGDYQGSGHTAEEAVRICLDNTRRAAKSNERVAGLALSDVPPIPAHAISWTDRHFQVYEADRCRWRTDAGGLHTFCRYQDGVVGPVEGYNRPVIWGVRGQVG